MKIMSGKETLVDVFLREICEGKTKMTNLNNKDRKKLEELIKKLDKLDISSSVEEPGFIKTINKSRDRYRNGEIYKEIFEILSTYHMPPNFYCTLRRCFEELNLKPNDDINNAINYFSKISKIDEICGTRTFIKWADVKKN